MLRRMDAIRQPLARYLLWMGLFVWVFRVSGFSEFDQLLP